MDFSFEKLSIYQKSIDLVDDVYGIIRKFPTEERYVLSDQLRLAVTSIPLNIIAEGYGMSQLQLKNHLNIAKGSLREVVAILIIAKKRDYVSVSAEQNMREKLTKVSKMISGMLKKVSAK